MRRAVCLLALALPVAAATGGTGGLRPPLAPAADPADVLKEADRKFAAAAKEKGLDGWMAFMADDAVRVTKQGEKAAVGKAAVRKVDAAIFADPKKRLVWEPTDAGLFADGKTGFTTGRSRVVTAGADGKDQVVWSGAYLTWWRKEADGSWKVILDTGVSDPPAKK